MYRVLGLLALVGCATGSLCLLLAARAAEPPATQPVFPLWDARESIEQYAKRVNLPPTKTLDLGNGVNLELVLIPAGKFIMGTPEPESPWIGGAILGIAGLAVLGLVARLLWRALRQHRRPQFALRWLIGVVLVVGVAQYGGFRCWRAVQASRGYSADESPVHKVALTTPFYISKFETTQGQYQHVMDTNPSPFKGPNLPVETISWDDAQAFCKKVSEVTGQTVRLPSEGEWEYSCRAGTATAYCSGDEEADLDRVGWYAANSKDTMHPVGLKEPNAWGVYDMHGNVWEWCRDWYEEYKPGAVVDPQGPTEGQLRALRGGCWFNVPSCCRSAYRGSYDPTYPSVDFGFRVVVALAPRTP